jgi:uncharacterized protein (TIGR03437 family)
VKLLPSALLLFALPLAAAPGWTLIGWNDLGMHCLDNDYSVYAILPPYNNIHAQLIDPQGNLVRNPAGITISYSAVPDATGSVNSRSDWKTNFWQFVKALFGVSPAPNAGLTSNSMPASDPAPVMKFDSSLNWFTADGIPLTPYDDAGNKNYYPLMRLTARDAQGNVLATTDIVLPISDEMDCSSCHSSGARADTQPSAGWANDAVPQRDYKLNILRLHDDKQLGSDAYATALAGAGYSTAGLATTAGAGTPILCAACHASNALGTRGQPGTPPLTQSIHSHHANVADPATGTTLDSASNRSACYRCHPGSETRCLRGVMGNSIATGGTMAIQCQNCHGDMSSVGASRQGWLEEPNCQACHTGTAARNSGQIRFTSAFEAGGQMRQPADATFATTPNTPAAGLSLYRFSTGHGGLQCEACHGSTHAEFPSSHANDNVQSVKLQGYAGNLAECSACHTSVSTSTGGPHGMHPVGQQWVQAHSDVAEHGRTACQACHGTDYRGTVLSEAFTTRTLTTRWGAKQLWRGFQVGCYLCHNGPSSESGNSNAAPVVSNGSTTTTAGAPVAYTLGAYDPNGGSPAIRIVSQPANGTVALNGAIATYTPHSGFEGTDQFTFAAWDGQSDSNLGTVSVNVTAASRPSFTAQGITSAGSYVSSVVTPGEIVAIFGQGLGPDALASGKLNSAYMFGRLLAGTRVLFDGHPAPLIYTSAGQVSAIVPYAVAGQASTQVQVEYQGIPSAPVTVPVADAVPALFSRDMSGAGQGAILNQDMTPNSISNPAAPGSILVMFATGAGRMDAPVIDGSLSAAPLPKPALPVTVQIGGINAPVEYSGAAPSQVAGVLQLNVRIPADAPSGGAVPVVVKVGLQASQPNLTVAIR